MLWRLVTFIPVTVLCPRLQSRQTELLFMLRELRRYLVENRDNLICQFTCIIENIVTIDGRCVAHPLRVVPLHRSFSPSSQGVVDRLSASLRCRLHLFEIFVLPYYTPFWDFFALQIYTFLRFFPNISIKNIRKKALFSQILVSKVNINLKKAENLLPAFFFIAPSCCNLLDDLCNGLYRNMSSTYRAWQHKPSELHQFPPVADMN